MSKNTDFIVICDKKKCGYRHKETDRIGKKNKAMSKKYRKIKSSLIVEVIDWVCPKCGYKEYTRIEK